MAPIATRVISPASRVEEPYTPVAAARLILAVSAIAWAGLLGAIFALI